MIDRGVKCDEVGCDWTEQDATVIEWLDKPCPKCKQGVIVTLAELVTLQVLKIITVAAPYWMKGETPRIDVGPMRRGLPPAVILTTKEKTK